MDERMRIEKIIETYNLSARQFADEVGIQAGTISNIMGGRNNPSLDVLQKVYRRYPDLNPSWLFAGQGAMFQSDQDVQIQQVATPKEQPQEEILPQKDVMPSARAIQRICIFYSDGTFEER